MAVWTGSVGRWSDVGNWSTNVIPNNDGTTFDVLVITNDAVVEVDVDVRVDRFEVGLRMGPGNVRVPAGSTLTTSEANIGTLGAGEISVIGDGAVWTNEGRINVGVGGDAKLNVEEGADVMTGQLLVAQEPGSDRLGVGEVNVVGSSSTVTVNDRLVVGGSAGFGTLNVFERGRVISENDVLILRQGVLSLNDLGSIDAPSVTVSGRIEGTGSIAGQLVLRKGSQFVLDVNNALRPHRNAIATHALQIREGATLELEASESLPELGDHQLIVFRSASGAFSSVPQVADGQGSGHLGSGVFFEGINYQEHVFEDRVFMSGEVSIDLFQAFAGDANGDGSFNSGDLVHIFKSGQFEDNIPGNASWTEGDWNHDHEFSSDDLIIAFLVGKSEQSGGVRVVVVPEPSTLCLFIVGVLLLGGRFIRH